MVIFNKADHNHANNHRIVNDLAIENIQAPKNKYNHIEKESEQKKDCLIY